MSNNEFFFLLDDIRSPDDVDQIKPAIFSSPEFSSIPDYFNAVRIPLNGRVDSSLDWRAAKEKAQHFVGQGKRIFWDLDLGLFSSLPSAFMDQTQFMALGLSIQHFRDFIWKEFSQHSIGVLVYRGTPDFSEILKWEHELNDDLQVWLHERSLCTVSNDALSLFCCDTALNYINLLAAQMPGELPVCVMLDTKHIGDPFLLGQLLSKERFERLHRLISESILPMGRFAQVQEGVLADEVHACEISEARIGICLPTSLYCCSSKVEFLKKTMEALMKNKIAFRFVSEATMTIEWDGLDYLVVAPETFSQQGMRKLNGFCAAGGTLLLENGAQTKLPNALLFDEIIKV